MRRGRRERILAKKWGQKDEARNHEFTQIIELMQTLSGLLRSANDDPG
jgi:hypothetical protein